MAPLTLTAIREQYVDMTTPFMQTGIGFIVHKDVACDESSFSLLAPFSTEMWVGILIAFVLTGLCIFLVGRYVSPFAFCHQLIVQPGIEQKYWSLCYDVCWSHTAVFTLTLTFQNQL